MSLENTEGIKKQAQELIEQAYQRGFKKGQVNNQEFHESICDGCKKGFEDREIELIEYGRDEAWEAALKIIGHTNNGALSYSDLRDVFGSDSYDAIIQNFSASDAIAKIREWEEKQKKQEEMSPENAIDILKCKEAIKKLKQQQAEYNDKYVDFAGINDAYNLVIRSLEAWEKVKESARMKAYDGEYKDLWVYCQGWNDATDEILSDIDDCLNEISDGDN